MPPRRPTTFSVVSSNFQKIAAERYTRGMSQALRTQPTAPPAVYTLPVPSSSTQSPSQTKLGPSLSTFDVGELARKVAAKRLVRVHNLGLAIGSHEPRAAKQHRAPEARTRSLPIPPPSAPTAKGPAPYPQHLPLSFACTASPRFD